MKNEKTETTPQLECGTSLRERYFSETCSSTYASPRRPPRPGGRARARRGAAPRAARPRPSLKGSISNLTLIFHPNEQTLQGSFSAVSTPNFARKYSLESSRRGLHSAILCTFLVDARLGEEYTNMQRIIEKMKSGKG